MIRGQYICQQFSGEIGLPALVGTEKMVSLWSELFAPITSTFFTRHPRYIEIDIVAASAEDHRAWFGWCESRLRTLFLSLEQVTAFVFSSMFVSY